MATLDDITCVLVPSKVAYEGQEVLRAAGKAGLEGMVLWAGCRSGATFTVTNLVVPRQRGLRTKDGVCVVVDGDELHRLNVYLHESDLRLIAQVHSHPREAYHSETDDRYAVATTIGCFSLVVPDFAARPFALADCATYRLSEVGIWDPVDTSASPHRIIIGNK